MKQKVSAKDPAAVAERDHLPQCGTRRPSSLAQTGDFRTDDVGLGNYSAPSGHPTRTVTKSTSAGEGHRTRMISMGDPRAGGWWLCAT
jgi:hypothetical protein